MTATQRPATAIDHVADAWVDTFVQLIPEVGTYIGRTEQNHRHSDQTPAGHDAIAAAARNTVAALAELEPVDDIDAVTKTDLTAELNLMLEQYEAKTHLRDLNVIESPAQQIRSVYDLMPTDTEDDWSIISRRLSAVPAAIDGYIETLREGMRQGVVPARRQVLEVVTQIARYTADDGFFAAFAAEAAPADGELSAALLGELGQHADLARA